MESFVTYMNREYYDRQFNNSNNNSNSYYSSNISNPIYYNSTIPDSSRIVFDSDASWAVPLNEGYSVIHVNNISRNFCANHCK
jgi:hypothetical protein